MNSELAAIEDFVQGNRSALAAYVRQKIIAAGAKPYLDSLGKEGIDALDREAAGVLVELACALLRRLDLERSFEAEKVLAELPDSVRRSIRLPRSEAYYNVLAELENRKPT
jgi:hypothetical protein